MGKTSCLVACSCRDDMAWNSHVSAAPFEHTSCFKPKRCDRSVLSPLVTNCRAQYARPLLPRLLHGSGAVRVDPPLQVFERLDPPTTVAGRTAQPNSG